MTKANRSGGKVRTALMVGLILGTGILSTAAAVTDAKDSVVHLTGANNRFNIMVAGSEAPGWMPVDADWVEGNPDSFRIQLTTDGSAYVMSPGAVLNLRVAVKNASPELTSDLRLEIIDPDPHGSETDPVTGNFVELFDQLYFTVKEGNTVLMDRVHAADLDEIAWLTPDFYPGDVKVLDVAIEMPASLDNRWQLASTDIQFYFEAENQ